MTLGRPFSAERYVLQPPPSPRPRATGPEGEAAREPGAPALTLGPVSSHDAAALGRAFAAMEPWSRYPFSPETLTAYLTGGEPHAPRFVIEADGEIAGVAGFRLELLRGPYLQFLGVLPAFQGSGIGAQILAWMEREAGPQARNLWVCASDFNTDALRFYERHGFTRVAVLDGLVQDGHDEVLLRKRLK